VKRQKGIAEVVDFLQNDGFLQTDAKLFSLRDELRRILCARFWKADGFEVVFG